jgi:glycosyltransferase involved in cell wall biosynthesis
MHILFLTQIIPYPPDAGPRVKTWHVLRYLAARGHRVTMASFVRPEEEPFLDEIRKVCAAVYTVPIHRSRLADVGYWLRSNWTGRPFLIERDDLSEMRSLVQRLVTSEQVDVIHADQLTMAQFALPFPGHIRIFDAHNAVWTIVDRMRQNAPWFLKPVAALESWKVKRYEGMIVREFDHTLAVTGPDRQSLLEAVAAISEVGTPLVSSKITVVPIAVDTLQLQPIIRQVDSTNLLTLGTLHYPPNADGIRWFAREVFPLVRRQMPSVTLTIVGKNPPADIIQFGKQQPNAITVTGYVPDLDPYIEKAALMVIAVRAGGGMRVRILEAFARAVPVVTTTIGLEGIEARPGEDVMVADTPAVFAQMVVELLRDRSLQTQLANNGRRLAENSYDWQVVLQKMDQVYTVNGSDKAQNKRNGSV